jgi:Fic family protein
MSKGAEGGPSGFPSFTTAADPQQNTAERLKEIQLENAELWFAACDSVRKTTQRAVLTAINDGIGSCTRTEIEEYTSVSDRTIRKQLGKLKEKELVETVESRTQAVSYASFEAEVLVSHALDCYFNTD